MNNIMNRDSDRKMNRVMNQLADNNNSKNFTLTNDYIENNNLLNNDLTSQLNGKMNEKMNLIKNKKTPKASTPKKIRVSSESVIKEKKNTTVKSEIIYCIENNIIITIALLSKMVGVSTHRIRKYCKANFIDLEKINKNNFEKMLDPKRIKEIKKQEKLNLDIKKKEIESKKIQDKLEKSLSKQNQTSSKHKMPINIQDNEKILLSTVDNKIVF